MTGGLGDRLKRQLGQGEAAVAGPVKIDAPKCR